jgi:hypothetical protein
MPGGLGILNPEYMSWALQIRWLWFEEAIQHRNRIPNRQGQHHSILVGQMDFWDSKWSLSDWAS